MDSIEFEMWRTIDVGGYAASISIFNMNSILLKHYINNNMKAKILAGWSNAKERYEALSSRFKSMDLQSLDERVPIDIIKELKEEVIPNIGAAYFTLDGLLQKYVVDDNSQNEPVLKQIDACKPLIDRMSTLGLQFLKNEKYHEYRDMNPKRINLS